MKFQIRNFKHKFYLFQAIYHQFEKEKKQNKNKEKILEEELKVNYKSQQFQSWIKILSESKCKISSNLADNKFYLIIFTEESQVQVTYNFYANKLKGTADVISS